MRITQDLLDSLTEQAKASPRLRMAMDLRNTPNDQSQRMLNALEPGTVMPIHRHLASSETVVILRGKIHWFFYDDAGKVTEEVLLDANGEVRCINVEKGRWHSLECMESGSVIMESKDGQYAPLTSEEIMEDMNSKHNNLLKRLREFMEHEARSCSMDPGCITAEYVYRMWGGSVPLEEIEKAMEEVRRDEGLQDYRIGVRR